MTGGQRLGLVALAAVAFVGIAAMTMESRMKVDPSLTAYIAPHADRLAQLDIEKIEARSSPGPEPLYVVQFKDGGRAEYGIANAAGWFPGMTGTAFLKIDGQRGQVQLHERAGISERNAELTIDTMIERAESAAAAKAVRP